MQKIVLTIAAALLFLNSFAQNKDELQKQRQQLKKEIEETERVLNETKYCTVIINK
jgi:cell shape-determining protein MreC